MVPKVQPHNRLKDTKKRPMNAMERFHVKRLVNMGCLICKGPAEYNHVKDGPGAKRDHKYGCPLCPRHHRITVDSKVSYESMSREAFNELLGFDLLEWCKDQWAETERIWSNKHD